MIGFQEIGPRFVAEVTGFDGTRASDRETRAALYDALYRHRVLLFREQRLTPAQLETFGRLWGEPFLEPYDNLVLPQHPAIMQVGNVGKALEPEEYRNGAAFWHTDRGYAADPNAVTILYCIEAPASGGATLIADLVQAYAALDDAARREIDGLHAFHSYGGGDDREEWEHGVHPMSPEQAALLPPPGRHPVARRHSVTGETGLYAIAGSAVDMDPPPNGPWQALLRRLKLHAIEPRFVHRHAWHPGDIALWDNTATLHCAEAIGAATDASTRRLLYRIVATGLPPEIGMSTVPHARNIPPCETSAP
ncbi:MAG: TauD/TfdA family dioxygenase [Dongiaceae bacterium]